MDRGEGHEGYSASAQGLEGVAADASTRVGEILAAAERYARDVAAETRRSAAETRRSAEREVERIAEETRDAARTAARERAERLAELQAALTARGPAVVEGLEGEGLTRARLEEVIEALAAIAEDVIAEAEAGDPRAGAGENPGAAPDASRGAGGGEPDDAEAARESPAGADEGEPGESAADEDAGAANPASEPTDEADVVAAAEGLAKPVADAPAGDGNGSAPYHGALPEGAPLARRPQRSRERDARFAALLLAVQGRAREDVESHLRREYGFDDVESILDEVFGRAPA